MDDPALSTGEVSQSQRSPLAPGALRQLFFSPSAYFRSTSLDADLGWLFVVWISGISSVIDRVDQRLLRADMNGGGSSGMGAIESSWYDFWGRSAWSERCSLKKTAEPLRTPPFLLEHHSIEVKATPNGNCIEASLRWTSIARVAKACAHPPRPSGRLDSST